MTQKRKRRSSIVEIGSGPSRVKIYTINRSNGYPMFSLYWKEGGRRRCRHLACMEEARIIAQQISVRLANGFETGNEATRRNLELLRHCENLAGEFGVTLTAAMDEWASARRTAGEIPIADAVRFYAANRADLVAIRTTVQVANEFIASRETTGVSDAYVRGLRYNLQKFTERIPGKITEVTVTDINQFLINLKNLGPVTRNAIRRNLVTMFGFAKKQGYLHPDRKTAAEMSESFKVPTKKVDIFTPEEMEKILLSANARILPLIAIGGFAGFRSAEILRLDWEDIKWDRGHIELAGNKAKTNARRIVPLTENLKAWLAPWRGESGPIITVSDYSGPLGTTAIKAGIPGGWRQNALRHSFISYRVAETGDVARTSLEAGNSPKIVFRNYREVVDEEAAKAWFSIMPPEGWLPPELKPSLRERLQRLLAEENPTNR
jgi:integrase